MKITKVQIPTNTLSHWNPYARVRLAFHRPIFPEIMKSYHFYSPTSDYSWETPQHDGGITISVGCSYPPHIISLLWHSPGHITWYQIYWKNMFWIRTDEWVDYGPFYTYFSGLLPTFDTSTKLRTHRPPRIRN